MEPGNIEFGWNETIIRIHPKYADDPFALTSILCHELAHFILDQNGFRKDNRQENEKLTDFFVFNCGQGLIYLQGIVDMTQIKTQRQLKPNWAISALKKWHIPNSQRHKQF